MPLLDSSVAVLAVLCGAIALSEWLVRNTWLRHVGTALLVIVVTAVLANAGLIPTYGTGTPLYDALFGEVIALAIFWLLLGVQLAALRRAGPQMLGLFAVGALGIAAGVVVGLWALGGPERFGEHGAGLGAMFVGTYTGGSVNFNTLASMYRVDEQPGLFAGAAVVDSLMTTVWMIAGVAVPRWLRAKGLVGAERPADTPAGSGDEGDAPGAPQLGIDEDTEAVHPLDLALALGLGLGTVAASRVLGAHLELHPHLVLTVLALVMAQIPFVARLKGTRSLGMFAVYLFLTAIGALCDVAALRALGQEGLWLLALVVISFTVHGLLVFGLARVFRISPELASVASQANVGGGSSALALARSLGRPDLVLPAILVGSLGTASGTFLGIYVGSMLLGGQVAG